MSDPELSVVVCVLDGEPWIGRQLDALRGQHDPGAPWEVVVADNGSTDGTVELVQAEAMDFPVPLRVVDASDLRSVGHARNVGALAARGALLAFCDCDDVVAQDWVREARAALAEAHVAMGLIRELKDPIDPDARIVNPGCVVGTGIMSGNFAMRRAAFLDVGGFDVSLPPWGCEDSEFAIRVRARGHPITPAPTMLMYFRPTTGLRGTLRKIYRSGQAEVVVWERHPDRYDPATPGRLIRGLLVWPRDMLAARRAGGLGPQSVARSLITRVAHLTGWWTLLRGGRLGPPRLVGAPAAGED